MYWRRREKESSFMSDRKSVDTRKMIAEFIEQERLLEEKRKQKRKEKFKREAEKNKTKLRKKTIWTIREIISFANEYNWTIEQGSKHQLLVSPDEITKFPIPRSPGGMDTLHPNIAKNALKLIAPEIFE